MSIHSLYEMSRRSFRAIDAAMNVTGQNVANANTEGYTRKRITLQADSPAVGGVWSRIPGGVSYGIGVSATGYERLRDALLDKASWDAHSTLGSSQEDHRILGALESMFPANGPGSLTGLLNDFWNGWSDLADNPTDNGVRLTLRSKADALAKTLNQLDGQLQAFEEDTKQVLVSGLDEINGLLNEIADLNVSVREAEFRGSPDLEAADLRDQKVKALSEFLPVKVQERTDGYALTVNGMTVVQGDRVDKLVMDGTGGTTRVMFEGTGVEYEAGASNDGKLGSWLRAMNDTIPTTRSQLDQLARGLVTQVNALHTARYDDTGASVAPDAPAFFHYSNAGGVEDGVTASSIRLSDDVKADASIIGTPGYYTAGGDEIAFAIANLRQTALVDANGDATPDETAEHFVINLISDLGAKVKQASGKASAQATVVDHLHAMAAAVSGVSLEEEMTNLIRFQQAFGAAARVLTTTEEMMDTLLAM